MTYDFTSLSTVFQWMTYDFTSLSTVFQSYQNDVRVIIERLCAVERPERSPPQARLERETAKSAGQR